jgi:hypothetical protein
MQFLLGHTKLESTVRYDGIEFNDAEKMSKQTEVLFGLPGSDRPGPRSLVRRRDASVVLKRSFANEAHTPIHSRCLGR